MEELLRLTEEQRSLLQKITDAIVEFRNAGGNLFYDWENEVIYAVNSSHVTTNIVYEDYYDEFFGDGWKAINEDLTLAPFSMSSFHNYSSVMAKLKKNPNPNLF